MRIYTSYYGNESIPYSLVRVSISRGVGFGKVDFTCTMLAPSVDLLDDYLNGFVAVQDYTIRFNEQLDVLDKSRVIEALKYMSKDKDVVLLCYEKEGFCHRHLVAKWFSDSKHKVKEI